MPSRVLSVHLSAGHTFSKEATPSVTLVAGLGVEGDAHFGATVKHRSRVARDPTRPNLRQVHLLQGELLDELAAKGFPVHPGALGENVTTRGLDLLALAEGAELYIGAQAVVVVTGLRNPCLQLDAFSSGLMAAVLDRAADGSLVRKAGVMGTVRVGGIIRPGDPIQAVAPAGSTRPLRPV